MLYRHGPLVPLLPYMFPGMPLVDRYYYIIAPVLPLSVVDNSVFSPIRLTVHSDSPYDQEAFFFSFQAARIGMAVHVFLLVVCLILSLALLWCLDRHHLQSSPLKAGRRSTLVHRLLRPRTPLDCPICRLSSSGVGPAPAPVRPWCEVKSRRGAPKRVNTEGFACPNPQCVYSGISDAYVHALLGDGKHGHAERIQTFRGPACRTTFTSRRNTPLYRLKTPSPQIAMVLSALAEGLDPSAAERVFGYRQATITTWLLVVSVSQNWPVRTSHHVSCSLPIPQRKSTMASIHLPIFTRGEHLLCTGFSPSSRAGRACVFGRSTTALSTGPNRTPPRCCLRR
jgi:transposase-like protein